MKRVALVVPVLLLAAACGGSDDDKKASGDSKAAYLTKAEAICTKVNADYAGLEFPKTTQAFPTYVQGLIDLAQKAQQDLEALDPPAADKADIESKVMTPLKGQIELAKAY